MLDTSAAKVARLATILEILMGAPCPASLYQQMQIRLQLSVKVSDARIFLRPKAHILAIQLPVFSSTFTPTSATPTSPSLTTSSSMISSPTTSPTTSTTTRGGDIAGAVVGGTAGIVIIGGLLWFFVRKKKSSKTTASGVSRPPAEGYVSKDEGNQYTGYYATPTAGPSEIGGTPTAELTGVTDRGRSEMP
ncbi:hypothetical protein CHU98_g5591 [Xylaria longipes]|nr:hypothetical protein CHU98_g5591 [Xylaria longipes]